MEKSPLFDPIEKLFCKKNITKSLLLIQLLIIASVSNAWIANPGATCPAGYIQGTATNADYTTLMNSYNNGSYVTLAGSNGIPLQVKMTKTESNSSTTLTNFGVINNGTYSAINYAHDMPVWSDYGQVTFDFQNSSTSQPIYLTNVALSAFDIDYDGQAGTSIFDDAVKITGTTSTGATIQGTIQPITGSEIVNNASDGLVNNVGQTGCTAKTLDSRCQGSIQFASPVNSVTIRYSNTNTYGTFNSSTASTNQEIDFRLDNYCYAPPPAGFNITKDDKVTTLNSGNNTTYIVKVTNTGSTTLTNILLKDPAVTGSTKLNSISCDTTDTNSICTSSTLPSITQLEGSGYTIASLAPGKTYSINVPVNVSLSGGSFTNTATATQGSTTQSASDTDTIQSPFLGTVTPGASCPSGDQMYFLSSSGTTTPTGAKTLPMSWTTGNTSKTFTFTDVNTNKTFDFNISFTNLKDLDGTGYPYMKSTTGGSQSDAPIGSLVVAHSSTSQRNVVNHTLNLSASIPVDKMGFTINDADWADSSANGYYIEQLKISSGTGKYSSNYPSQQTVSADGQTLTATAPCGAADNSTPCPAYADWTDVNTNNTVSSDHLNIYSKTASTYYHWLSYGGFYVCVAPPKVIFKKQVNSLSSPSDTFNLNLKNGTTQLASLTTSGTGTFSSTTTTLPSTTATYTITETATSGNLTNYQSSYQCTNANTTTTTLPTTSTAGSSISLSNLNSGDRITCTIVNSPIQYTFSGIVFNDNGGMATDLNNPATNTYPTSTTNTQYFNGVYDPSVEKGISESGLQVQLASNCNTATPTLISSAVNVNTDGTYNITATPSQMSGATNVCVIEREPNGNLTSYPVDTTNNQLNVNFVSTTYNYTGINFGEVSKNNEGLVLVKEQTTNDCNISVAQMLALTYTTTLQSNIDARKCVAYKITAYNRTNLIGGLTNVQITDTLPKKGVNNSTVNSLLANPVDTTATNFKVDSAISIKIGENGTVKSDLQNLPLGAKRSLYFNTKYDANSK